MNWGLDDIGYEAPSQSGSFYRSLFYTMELMFLYIWSDNEQKKTIISVQNSVMCLSG